MMEEKSRLNCLFCENPATPEGKYLVKRRDGTVVEWPSFVLGARDPIAPWALRMYAIIAVLMGYGWKWPMSCWRRSATFARYRKDHGKGDPEMGDHRKDDPVTIAEMRKGLNS